LPPIPTPVTCASSRAVSSPSETAASASRTGRMLMSVDSSSRKESIAPGAGSGTNWTSSLLRRGGDPEAEGGALADLALDPDGAAVAADDLARDEEAEAQTVLAALAGVALRELVEQAVAPFGRDARAGVGHVDTHE